MSVPRLVALYKLSREIDRQPIPGNIVECGVRNGGSSAVMASVFRKSSLCRDMWLFDSFEGLPEPTAEDGYKAQTEYHEGKCLGSVDAVKEILNQLSIPENRVHIIEGWFEETFPSVKTNKVALLHIDADWYESVKLCLEKFYDSVCPGGFIALDDYGHWEGCRRATDEFLKKRSLDIKLVRVDDTGHYFQKPQKS
ncbi:MAG: class I SAM-dependent methyltransferase [Dehalococcoidia bacterium]|nr:class I SAM-dependent methyltransferase [Dehalococcoidia bacterium]